MNDQRESEDASRFGEAGRPYGVSTSEDSTGVDPQEPVDEESPYLPRGD